MITAESSQGRRIIGSLDRGAELVSALKNTCRDYRVQSGEIRAIGTLEQAEVCSFDQQRRRWGAPRLITGGMELLNLAGNVSEQAGSTSVSLQVTVMRDRDTGMELVGGHLLSARVFHLEFVIEAFDDIQLRRAHDPERGMSIINDSSPASSPLQLPDNPEPTIDHIEPVPTAHIYDSDDTEEVGDFAEEVTPLSVGDVILHPKFRRCVVQRIEGAGEFAQVRLRNGRVVRLSLAVLSLTFRGTEDEQRVYEAVIG